MLKKIFSKNSIDIIHAHTRVTQVLGWFLAKKLKISLVTTCHGFFKPRWHRKIFPCWGNKVVAISSQVKNHLICDFKINEGDICLIHNGIEPRKFSKYSTEEVNNLKKEIGIPDSSIVVGCAARFSEVKGLKYLIRAIPFVLKQNHKVFFLLIGEGKEELNLRQIAKDSNIEDKIIFFKPNKDSYEYLCVMNVFVMPSIQEGLGLSILEAQAQKIPVIASNVGGIPDIIEHKVTGILVQPKDHLAISEAILELIQDEYLYARIKNNAYNNVLKEFTLEQMITKTEKVYRDCYVS
jgi:glycosyltransferase involved in cell wall biosynthesis